MKRVAFFGFLQLCAIISARNVPMLGLDQNITVSDGTVKNVHAYLSEFVKDYQKVQAKKSKEEMKRITTLGILSGVIKVEDNMKAHLSNMSKKLLDTFTMLTTDEIMSRLFALEQTMDRDKKAIAILNSALEFARSAKTYEEYVEDIEIIARENEITAIEMAKKKQASQIVRQNKAIKFGNGTETTNVGLKMELKRQINQMVMSIEQHIDSVHSTVKRNARKTIKYLKNTIESAEYSEEKPSYNDRISRDTTMISEIITEAQKSLKYAERRFRRQDTSAENQDKENQIDNEEKSPEKESESESSEEAGPGGLAGLLAGLSGGDEGSDIGALVGALSGLVTNLFGPGGLDVNSLLSTATSLISGLLAGDENFGKVLGGYIGTTVDGLSGGGGAILNGQFFGQLMGTVFAQLSADPEDDDLPPKPKIFIENLFSGSKQAYSKAGDASDDEEEKPNGGSDVFGFIGNIVGSIVAGITSLIVNSSVGSSGGSSQGSGDLSAGSIGASSDSKPSHPDSH